jgi:hypothetical protein
MLKRLLRWVVIAAMSHFWNLEASKVFTSELVQGLASEDVQHTAKIGSGAARVLAERLSDLQRSRIGPASQPATPVPFIHQAAAAVAMTITRPGRRTVVGDLLSSSRCSPLG